MTLDQKLAKLLPIVAMGLGILATFIAFAAYYQ